MKTTNYNWRVNFDEKYTKPNVNDPLNLNISYPADYEITFTDQFSDSADNRILYGTIWQNYPTKFSVYNLTENKPSQFAFREEIPEYRDSTLSPFLAGDDRSKMEQILLWVSDPDPGNVFHLRTTWRLFLEGDTTLTQQIPPASGDIFRIATKKPFRTGDDIKFRVQGHQYSLEKAKSDLDKIAVVPNPYVVTASWEPRSPYRFGRGERRIEFIHLPQQCTIRIYTLRGYLVNTIIHDSSINDGSETWDMLSKDGREIAYGVYIFHVDAGKVGEKIGKFAVIK